MIYAFPDTEMAVLELLTERVPEVETYLHLPANYTDLLPVFAVRLLPSNGGEEDFLRTDRLEVNVYASGRTEARDLAGRARQVLLGAGLETSYGLLDHVYIETEPYEVPLGSDLFNNYSITIRADIRPL